MHNKIFLALTMLLTFAGYGQAYETSTTFKKNPTPALAIEVPYTMEITEGTLITRLDQAGADIEKKGALFWKSNKIDGFLTYKNTALTVFWVCSNSLHYTTTHHHQVVLHGR